MLLVMTEASLFKTLDPRPLRSAQSQVRGLARGLGQGPLEGSKCARCRKEIDDIGM